MLKLKPLAEKDASPSVQQIYAEFKKAFDIQSVPLFIQYLGAFPQYLKYLREPLLQNIRNHENKKTISETGEFVIETLAESFSKGPRMQAFLTVNQFRPEMVNLKDDLKHIAQINATLAHIFIALRESIKGFAVAAKQIGSAKQEETIKENLAEKSDLVYGQDLYFQSSPPEKSLVQKLTGIVRRESGITKSPLPEYLQISREEFEELLKQQRLLFLRVELEKIILRNIQTLNTPIISPINVVLELTKEYPNFVDLLYLLSDSFPSLAVQRLLYSSWIIY